MVGMYVDGQKVGTLDENPHVFRRHVEAGRRVEFRAADGRGLGAFSPPAGPMCPWEPDLTREEIDRRIREPGGMTSAEFYRQRKTRPGVHTPGY